MVYGKCFFKTSSVITSATPSMVCTSLSRRAGINKWDVDKGPWQHLLADSWLLLLRPVARGKLLSLSPSQSYKKVERRKCWQQPLVPRNVIPCEGYLRKQRGNTEPQLSFLLP